MPRVVPTQILAVIDEMFPWAAQGGIQAVNPLQVAGIRAIRRLTQELPAELLTLSGGDYTDYVVACTAIDQTLGAWDRPGNPVGRLHEVRGTDPLVLLHRLLSQCSDQAASSDTAELIFIDDDKLRESIRRDISAANRDLINGEWKGATVLAGAATEALLLWAIQEKKIDLRGATRDPKADIQPAAKKLSRKPHAELEHWHLADYIEVALELKLIADSTAKQARLANDFRNLIHPGRAARLGQRCDLGTAHGTLAAVAHVVRDLTA